MGGGINRLDDLFSRLVWMAVDRHDAVAEQLVNHAFMALDDDVEHFRYYKVEESHNAVGMHHRRLGSETVVINRADLDQISMKPRTCTPTSPQLSVWNCGEDYRLKGAQEASALHLIALLLEKLEAGGHNLGVVFGAAMG
jgi:hypothetical protein